VVTENKKISERVKIVISLLLFVVLLVSGFFYIGNTFFGQENTNTMESTENKGNQNIKSETANKGVDESKDIINIALFGIDTRANDYDGSRADTIMIVSLDTANKKLKITSIMRDTYVNIPGEKYDKINHAFAFGGPELTIKTINENFDMNIKDYITLNFSAMEQIVDAVGGVDIDVKDYEIEYINSGSSAKVTAVGVQTLNGQQALAYSRIRYGGNGDFERTDRQRTVLQNIINKGLNNISLPQALSLIEILSPYIETSLDKGEVASLATSVFVSGISDIKETRLPLEDKSKGGIWDGVYYLKPKTLSDNVSYLHDFIYEQTGYVPSSTVEQIDEGIKF